MNNGLSSGYFRVERGGRQGNPLSPYLFLLGTELFAENVRQDYLIRGIMINEVTEMKLIQYADDTTGILRDVESASQFLSKLKMFEKCSGLKINSEKSESMWLGVKRGCKEQPLNLNWVESIKSLGISLSYNYKKTMSQVNFDDKINKMISCLNAWRGRHLTINGRILLAKQVILNFSMYLQS